MALLNWLSLSLVLASSSHAAVQLTGTTINIDDVSFWIPPTPVGKIDSGSTAKFFNATLYRGYAPFTLIASNSTTKPESRIEQELSRFSVEDDVWVEAFSNRMLSCPPFAETPIHGKYLTLHDSDLRAECPRQ